MLRYCFYPITEMDEAGNCLLLIHRMMEQGDSAAGRPGGGETGGGRRRESGASSWFQDVRDTHQHQAEYLLKLARLRDELITQEHSNLLNAMERVYTEAYSRSSSHAAMPLRPKRRPLTQGQTPQQASGPQSFPLRHKKLQQEKADRLERFRRGRSPPVLEPIEGKQMADPSRVMAPIPAARDLSSIGYGGASLPMSVKYAEERISERELMKILSSGKNGSINLQQFIKPTSSIPHVGYKPLKADKTTDGKNSSRGNSNNNNSKSKQHKPTHTKAGHVFNAKTPGLYSGVTKHTNGHGFADRELSLSPCALSIETQIEKRQRMLEEDACSAPRATPEIWERYLAADIDTSQLPKGMKQRLAKAKLQSEHTPRNGVLGFNDFMVRRNTSFIQDDLSSARTYSSRTNEVNETLKFPSFRRHETNEWIDQVANENKPPGTSHEESGKIHEDLTLPNINQSQAQTVRDNLSLVSVDTERDSSPSCRKLVVEMPDITCHPPTPDPSPHDEDADDEPITTTANKSLQKTFKQNELRQKEIQNLLEDVKEFTQIAETLQDKVNMKQ